MSTIEQRAAEYAKRAKTSDTSIEALIRTAYLMGATQQKAIDDAGKSSTVKCCEFMPYDWAEDMNGNAVRVNSVGFDSMMASQDDDMMFFCDKDTPPNGIRITDDFLSRNGFEYDKDLEYWIYSVPGNITLNYYHRIHSVGFHGEGAGAYTVCKEYQLCP